MHRHEYEFWLRKYDLDGFSGLGRLKKGSGLNQGSSPFEQRRKEGAKLDKQEKNPRSVLLLVLSR